MAIASPFFFYSVKAFFFVFMFYCGIAKRRTYNDFYRNCEEFFIIILLTGSLFRSLVSVVLSDEGIA